MLHNPTTSLTSLKATAKETYPDFLWSFEPVPNYDATLIVCNTSHPHRRTGTHTYINGMRAAKMNMTQWVELIEIMGEHVKGLELWT